MVSKQVKENISVTRFARVDSFECRGTVQPSHIEYCADGVSLFGKTIQSICTAKQLCIAFHKCKQGFHLSSLLRTQAKNE